MKQFFDKAAKRDYTPLDPGLAADLEPIFATSVSGFREIVLVITLARLLNGNYSASTAFYDCNPRPMYEGPIRTMLDGRRIPRGQSGPLNVAKAAKAINEEWAAQRRPKDAAVAVVRLVKAIEAMSPQDLENFAVVLHEKFLDQAEAVKALNVEASPQSDPELLFNMCAKMIEEVPDGGNTPQRIVGQLLDSYHEDIKSEITVFGYTDRASVTSTTSKKPGDIAEIGKDGSIVQCYEVTVKKFGQSRVTECVDAFRKYNSTSGVSVSEVTVLCRKQDVHEDATSDQTLSGAFLGKLDYGGMSFYFVDIFEWIISQLVRMSTAARLSFFDRLEAYVRDRNTAAKVKKFWKDYHEAKLA